MTVNGSVFEIGITQSAMPQSLTEKYEGHETLQFACLGLSSQPLPEELEREEVLCEGLQERYELMLEALQLLIRLPLQHGFAPNHVMPFCWPAFAQTLETRLLELFH